MFLRLFCPFRGLVFWFIFVFAFFASPPSGAQEPDSDPEERAETTDPGETGGELYYIREIVYSGDGRTHPFALALYGELRTGELISGKENLERYIGEKTQLLLNQRVLETVSISYTLGEAEPGGPTPADLLVTTIDTWNIIALPYPKFDSNTGFELILKARDYNSFGTMSPLRFDLGYKMDADYVYQGFFNNLDKGAVVAELDSNTLFTALGYIWNFNFDHFFAYTYGEPLYYKNSTGISVDFPFRLTTFTFGFEESVVVYEKNDERYQGEYGKYFADAWYMSSELYAAWKIPTGLEVGPFGDLVYTPKTVARINYRPGGDIGYLRRGPTLTFTHKLGFDRINWIGNYRSGLEAGISNSNEYNIYRGSWNEDLSISAAGHYLAASFLGLSGRIQYKHWFNDYHDEAGDLLRGIMNKSLAADSLLALNLDFPFMLFRFLPSQWLKNPGFRFFDFEAHLSPFVDLALVRDPLRNIRFSPADLIAAGGLEFIVFPFFMRSIYLRLSLGFNMREFFKTGKLPDGNNRELFIGLGHHY